MLVLTTPQSACACKKLGQSTRENAVCGTSLHQSRSVQHKANQGPVVVSAVQRAQSPSRAPTVGRLTVPEAAPAVSSHPDAIRRRREAEARKQSRQEYIQASSSGKGWWEIQNPPNMHLVASTEEFRERIRLAKGESTLVVVDYFAPWCHACKSLHPKLQNIARSYRHVTFLSVNAGIDSLNAMCEEIGVPKLPYFHFLKGNNGVVAEFAANLTAQKLQQLRTQIAQHSAQ